MNIGTRFDLTAANDTALPRRSRLASDSSAFAENLAVERESFTHRCIQGPGFSLRMGENILCSGGVGGADVQTYEAEFTAGSTDEDPVVRIRGTANSGEFDFTCHIRLLCGAGGAEPVALPYRGVSDEVPQSGRERAALRDGLRGHLEKAGFYRRNPKLYRLCLQLLSLPEVRTGHLRPRPGTAGGVSGVFQGYSVCV